MHLIQDSCDSEYYAQKVPDNGGVYIVPAFTGLGAPYWDMYARGAILGITRGTTQNHIIRAAEESIAYQSADLMWAMEKDTDITISTLKVDGGASRDHFLMQFQSDILNKEVLRPAIRETTALGAAYLAGLATGVWKSREEISHLWSCNQLFEPKMDAAQREKADYAVDVYPHYGSDVEATLSAGNDLRHGLIGAGVYASHGYERSHIDGVWNTLKVLKGYLNI